MTGSGIIRKGFALIILCGFINNVSAAENEAGKDSVYIFEPFRVEGELSRDIISSPLTESAGLELSTSRIEATEMQLQGSKTAVDAVEYIPGAMVETRGRKVKQFVSIRGQRYPYPEYALNGAVFREFHEFPYFLSSSGIGRIEVLRSSSAMLSGVSGLSGLINIVPRRYESKQTEFVTEYGTFNTSRMGLTHGNRIGTLNYSISLDIPKTNGPSGKLAAERASNLSGNMQWQPSPDITMESSLYMIEGKRGLAQAEPPAQTSLQTANEFFDPLKAVFATVRALHKPDSGTSNELILFFSKREQIYKTLTDTSSTTNDEIDHEFGFNLARTMALGDNDILRASVYYNRWAAPNGKRFYYGKPCELETFSGTVSNERRMGRFVFDTGVRYEQTYIHEYGSFNIAEVTKGLSRVVPVTDQWEAPVLTGNIGAAFYASPMVSFHLNMNAGHIQPRRGTLDINMHEPKNETRSKADIGVNLNTGLGSASIVGFAIDQRDAIILSGKTTTLNGKITELYDNRDQRQYGIEIDTRTKPVFSAASFFLNGMALSSRTEIDSVITKDKELPQIIMSGGGLFAYKNYDLNLYWKYVSGFESARFAQDGLPKPLGDFHTFNLTCGVTLGNRHKNRIYAEIINLTDKKYSTVVGYPDYGRRVNIGVRQVY